MKLRMSDPAFVQKIKLKVDVVAMSRKVRESQKANKEFIAKIVKSNVMRRGAVQSAIVKRSWIQRHAKNAKAFGEHGNGRPPTKYEQMVLDAFPEAVFDYTIPTKIYQPGKGGWHYCKPDIAWPDIRLSVEVDGETHTRMKQFLRDKRKDGRLAELGWTVFRVSNESIDMSLPTIVEAIKSLISKLMDTQATPLKA